MKTPKCSNNYRHSWKCKENPGYIGIGGSAILYSEGCVHCEMTRSKVFGDVNVHGNRNHGFKYNP